MEKIFERSFLARLLAKTRGGYLKAELVILKLVFLCNPKIILLLNLNFYLSGLPINPVRIDPATIFWPRRAWAHTSEVPPFAMAQRSISSFFFKGDAAVGGAGGSAPAAGPDVPVPLVQAVEASVATLKRKRDFAHHDAHEREHANATASTPIESCDDHDEPVLTKGKAPVPATEKAQTSGNTMDVEHVEPIDTRVPIDGADDRDLVKRDLMRSKLATAVTGAETKHQAVRQRFQFLDHSNIRDGNGRAPGHEEYDTRTVLVPPELKLSASQQQVRVCCISQIQAPTSYVYRPYVTTHCLLHTSQETVCSYKLRTL
jgi:hypothetical protein